MIRWKLGLLLGVTLSITLTGCDATRLANPVPSRSENTTPAIRRLSSSPVILFASHDDLWRTDLMGTKKEQLSQGKALKWYQDWGSDWLEAAKYRRPQVAPDGQWVAFSTGDDVRIIEVAQHTETVVAQARAGVVDWAPDSRSFAYVVSSPEGDGLCIYNIERKAAECLPNQQNIKHFAWSPDNRYIAFTCCFKEVEPYTVTAKSVGQVQRLDVSTQQLEIVGQAQIGVASSCSLCWSADGRVITTTEGAVRCSPQDAKWSGLSADKTQIALITPLFSADGATDGARLTVALYTDDVIGSTLWERKIQEPNISRVYWSPDGQYLLLDDEARSPVWRLKADGTGQLEVVVDDGYLLGVIPKWGE